MLSSSEDMRSRAVTLLSGLFIDDVAEPTLVCCDNEDDVDDDQDAVVGNTITTTTSLCCKLLCSSFVPASIRVDVAVLSCWYSTK